MPMPLPTQPAHGYAQPTPERRPCAVTHRPLPASGEHAGSPTALSERAAPAFGPGARG